MKPRRVALTLALIVTAFAPSTVLADGPDDHALAESRLRGCLTAGASSAPGTTLAPVLVSTRAFCGPQIGTVLEIRVREATGGLSQEDAAEAKKRIVRQLNDEISRAVASSTGLTE